MGHVYAKSISQIKGEGNAQIAKWEFKVNGEETQMKSVSLKNTNIQENLIDGKIAPGTSGFFDIIIDATEAEVALDYSIIFTNETRKPTNLTFKCGDVQSKSIKDLEETLKGKIEKDSPEKIKIFSVEWQWNYETGSNPQEIKANDEVDTKDGLEISDYKFDIEVTGTQAVPEQNS